MQKYSNDLVGHIRLLRGSGLTYAQIRVTVGVNIPKSSFTYLCRGVDLPSDYQAVVKDLNIKNLVVARSAALEAMKAKRANFLSNVEKINAPIAVKIMNRDVAKLALAMLCLGEASKSKSKGNHFYLGNSDPRIVVLFIELLKTCFNFDIDKLRCTVQCRADQDVSLLETYWQKVLEVPKENFYKAQIDPRTIGKPTQRLGYMGVMRVDYSDRKIQLDLESLADLTYNQMLKGR